MRTVHFASAAMLCGVLSLGFIGLDQEYDISPKYKVGDTFVYKMAGNFEAMGMEGAMSGTTTSRVIEVQENGNIVMESSTGAMMVEVMGEQMELPEMPTVQMVMSPNGELVSYSGGDPMMMEGYGRTANMNSFIWPTGPVKIGDTWSHTFEANRETGGVAATVTYKVLEETRVLGAEALAISLEFKETATGGGSVSGVIWIEIGTGVMLQTDVEMRNVTMAGSPFPINGGTTLTLQR